jgi:predicted lipid-binding transport protein (Tim44 family)
MMKFLMLFTIAFTCLSLFAVSAEAKRFGGGVSIGKQRTITPQPAPSTPTAAPSPTQGLTPSQQPAGNPLLGALAGLAIGAGLGSLFAGGGLGGAMNGILITMAVGLSVMLLMSLFRKKGAQPTMQYASAGGSYGHATVHKSLSGSSSAPVSATGRIPADFPVDSFLRSAKTAFIRLQAANDRKDLNDIREYTTPEMFGEISMQMQERDNSAQKTDVITINAVLQAVVNEGDFSIASVRFTGQLSENNGAPVCIDEIWHVQKNLGDANSVWLLAGIQQTLLH